MPYPSTVELPVITATKNTFVLHSQMHFNSTHHHPCAITVSVTKTTSERAFKYGSFVLIGNPESYQRG